MPTQPATLPYFLPRSPKKAASEEAASQRDGGGDLGGGGGVPPPTRAWNPAAEDQCFDRCHRLGQKQDVVITKFIVKNSVEENMLKIQQKKRELAAGAFGTKTPSNEAKINEIKTLMDL